MAEKLSGVKGMNDILPTNSYQWLWLEGKLNAWLAQYGYNNMRTPILESTQLFTRSIGEVTDIVIRSGHGIRGYLLVMYQICRFDFAPPVHMIFTLIVHESRGVTNPSLLRTEMILRTIRLFV